MTMSTTWIIPEGTLGMVSVIVTAYNQKAFLREALDSVFAQTYRPLECVVVNDGSTDETESVIEEFRSQAASGTVQFIGIHQKNSGAQAARNAGVCASHGEFIQYLDGDDLLDQSKLAAQAQFLTSSAGRSVDVVFGDSQFLVKGDGDSFEPGARIGTGPTEDLFRNLLNGEWNASFAYLSRRGAVSINGPWDPELWIAQDHGYFLSMAAHGFRFKHLGTPTGFYRKHSSATISEGSMRLRAVSMLRMLRSTEALGTKHETLTPQLKLALARAFLRVSYWAYPLDRNCWRESMAEALRVHPGICPERAFDRVLHKVLGPWRAEECLGRARTLKRRFMAGSSPLSPAATA